MGFLKKLIVLVVLIGGGLWLYGRQLPREHSITSSIILVAPIDSVFGLIRAVGSQAAWWYDVKSVRPLMGKKRESWEQNMGDQLVQFEVTMVVPGSRMVTTILNDEQQDWGGTWQYRVFTSSAGTEVQITEQGWVEAPLFRVFMKLRGESRTVDSFLSSLGAHFGEVVTPRHGS